jgi:multidrug efflux pump subunit AcrA (membrane-fusion protein)
MGLAKGMKVSVIGPNQTSGYLKKWYFDIGSKVKAGAVLAKIDTPEVDQQLAQARQDIQDTVSRYSPLMKRREPTP